MRYWISLLCFVCVTSFADTNSTELFTSPTKTIVVNAGNPTVTLRLKTMGTAGYGWFWQRLEKNPDIELQSYRYIVANTRLIGAPGISEFVFQLSPDCFKAPEVLQIPMVYARSWELAAAKKWHPVRFTIVTESE